MCGYDPKSQNVTVDRLVDKPQCLDGTTVYDDWVADDIVKRQSGSIEIARRTRMPTSVDVKIKNVSTVSSDVFEIQLENALAQGDFVGGNLRNNDEGGRIISVSADRTIVHVSMSDATTIRQAEDSSIIDLRCAPVSQGPAAVLRFVQGLGRITENPHGPSLWTTVSSNSKIDPLAKQFTFVDNTPLPQEGTDLLVYSSRVKFNDFKGGITYGPYGNTVSILRKSPIPQVAPPFTIAALGWDYYQRLVVKITLAEVRGEQFMVAWARGRKSDWLEAPKSSAQAKAFASVGVPGCLGQQRAQQMRILYEVLDIPVPHFSDTYATIGVKTVDKIGQESPYVVEELLILAI